MKYDPSILIEKIIDRLEAEMTFLNEEFEFDDCSVKVVGTVAQDFNYDSGDYFTPPSCDLYSRVANLEITMATEDGERELTEEELYYIEKQIEL